MDRNSDTYSALNTSARAKLVGFAALMVLMAIGLALTIGPPGVPDTLPRPEDLLKVLGGSTLPMSALLLALVDVVWLLWAWILLSLALELVVLLVQLVASGTSWARRLRRFADHVSVPLVRRGVAAAFALQVISRGVPIAAAQTLPPVESVRSVALDAGDASNAGVTDSSTLSSTYLVRPGDTLWSIAEQAYGSGTEYRRLVDANVGRAMPDGRVFSPQGVIQPGWRLVAPGATWNVQAADGGRWYTVQSGDTLSSIAASVLGDDSRWREVFAANRGALGPDAQHTLEDPNTIWPGLRLRLPDAPPTVDPSSDVPAPPEASPTPDPESVELLAAAAPAPVADPAPQADVPGGPLAVSPVDPTPDVSQPAPAPLARTPHPVPPVVLEPADDSSNVAPDASPGVAAPAGDADVSLPGGSWRADLPGAPLAIGGFGLAGLAGLAFGARRMRRRLRPLPQEPESDVVVEGGFAEALLAHDLTRGLHGVGFDPLTAVVSRFGQFLAEYEFESAGVVAVRHGRSSTSLTVRCGLAEQPVLLDLAHVFADQFEAEVEACVTADQDVLLRLMRLRKTRLLPPADALAHAPCLVPLGVLYDRQVFSAAWDALGHVLVVSLPGHGSETILTSLVATLTARRSPEQLRVWMLATPRALPGPVFEVPHVARVVDPGNAAALGQAVEDLRAELDRRVSGAPEADLLVVVPELTSLGEQAATLALLAGRAAAAGIRLVAATSDPAAAAPHPLTPHFGTRLVLRMQTEEASVALLGVADAAFLGGGGRLLLRLDGREPVELYGYQIESEHLERLVKVMRSAYPAPVSPASLRTPVILAPPDAPVDDEPPTDWCIPSPPPPPAGPAAELLGEHPPSETHGEEAPTPPHVDSVDRATDAALAHAPIPIQIYCFGSPRVLCCDRVVWPHSGGDAKPWEFLLFLAVQPSEGVLRDKVVEAIWPGDEQPEDAGHRLRQLRYRMRHHLQAVPGAPRTDGVCTDRHRLLLDPGIVYSDAQEFLTLVRGARVNPGDDAIEQLERARALYVGDLLDGPDTRRYAWVDERDESGVTLREHFRRLFQNASMRLAELYTQAGALDTAVALYRELTDIDPADERLWQALFRLHAQLGDRDALIAEEQRLRQTLRDLAEDFDAAERAELVDQEPSREIRDEYVRLLAGLTEREPAAV